MGRRRRNAYWGTAGGAAQVQADNAANSELDLSVASSTSTTDQPTMNTRRSLRQLARKSVQPQASLAENDFEDEEGSDEEFARFTPLPAPRKKRFLKDSHASVKKREDVSETTAAVLNRLISKRVPKPGYVVKPGRFNSQKGKGAGASARNASAYLPKKNAAAAVAAAQAAASSAVNFQQQEMNMPMPLKVEIQEGHGFVTSDGPKKRGRKRKVDQPVNLSMKTEARQAPPVQREQNTQDPDWDPNDNMQRKRGRQSAATAIVKNRFPFCSLCLSKTPPSDYIINHMSCPNEYQRMKRLFQYIYKDLRFPFMPFDLERENVFDYCDLPLCDCCIQLYREIYDSYAQIETARDQLKSKIERMVYQIQLSEQNPAVAQQLGSIKNSPDALMNKYCNFRRRFSSYRPGDSRGDVPGASLVPATIARIRVMNQVPKRTTGSQTFLTAGHFPTPPPPAPAAAETPKTTESPTKSTTDTAATASSSSKTGGNGIETVVVKKEVDTDPPKASSSKPSSVVTNVSSTTISKPSKDQPPQKQVPKTTPQLPQASKVTASSKVQAPPPKPSTPAANPARPVPHSSVLTIIKTPGGAGPAIIRKLPAKPSIIGLPAKLLAIATPTHKTQASLNKAIPGNAKVNGTPVKTPQPASKETAPAKQNPVPSTVVVKDEPIDPEEVTQPTEEEADPFFSSDPSTDKNKNATPSTQERPEDKSAEKDDSASDGKEGNSKSDTNVFHKHKKLRVLPVPSYSCSKESSNDSSDNIMTNTEEDGKAKDNSDPTKESDSADQKANDSADKKQTQAPTKSTEEKCESTKVVTSRDPPSSPAPQQDKGA